jgi:hypothetical protein
MHITRENKFAYVSSRWDKIRRWNKPTVSVDQKYSYPSVSYEVLISLLNRITVLTEILVEENARDLYVFSS